MMIKKFLGWFMSYLSQNKNKPQSKYLKEAHNKISGSYEELLEKVQRLEMILEEKTKIADELKSAFLRNIYHEIRTPMNSIVGFTSLLNHGNITSEQRDKYAENIKTSSQQFLKLIDDLVEASLLDSGYAKTTKGECDLDRVMEDLHSLYTVQNEFSINSDIAFSQNPDSQHKELKIYSDKKMLFDIMSYLLSNAFKFTERGAVEYGYRILNDDKIMFYVKDSGVGIDKYDNSIFKNFTKSEHCLRETNKGLGLGLSIAYGKVKLLGGDIWVEPNEMKGTTFKFTVPMEKYCTAKSSKKTENFKNKQLSRVG
ncbi:MAG: HAMP domain-containing histidine kinase [Bacteroidales bacterium]|nr:MAG: HAMP domain-containing histidine kinase [Bacteroidales bacterium]